MAKKKAKLSIKQIRSSSKCLPKHKDTLRGLGLRRINHVVEREDTPSIRGMVNQISYLLQVEEL